MKISSSINFVLRKFKNCSAELKVLPIHSSTTTRFIQINTEWIVVKSKVVEQFHWKTAFVNGATNF